MSGSEHIYREQQNLLFLCGFPSSGTDLLRSLVNSHSQINVIGELPLLASLADAYAAEIRCEDFDRAISDLRRIDLHRHFAHNSDPRPPTDGNAADSSVSFATVFASLMGDRSTRWIGSKTPQFTEQVEKLDKLFPSARFILIVRDIRDVALSWRRKWGKNAILCASKWNERMSIFQRYRPQMSNDRVLVVRFEDILEQTQESCLQICSFLNLDFEQGMLSFHESGTDVIPGKINYGKPIIRENKEKWRSAFSEKVVTRIEEVAFDSLQQYGYTISTAERARDITELEKVLGYAHDAYATVAVGNRALEKGQFVDRVRTVRRELIQLFKIR